MPDLLLARAMLGDMSAAGEGQLLYMQGQWFGGLPGHLAALGLPAAAHLQLAAEFVAQRRQLANNAVGPAGAVVRGRALVRRTMPVFCGKPLLPEP